MYPMFIYKWTFHVLFYLTVSPSSSSIFQYVLLVATTVVPKRSRPAGSLRFAHCYRWWLVAGEWPNLWLVRPEKKNKQSWTTWGWLVCKKTNLGQLRFSQLKCSSIQRQEWLGCGMLWKKWPQLIKASSRASTPDKLWFWITLQQSIMAM